MNIRKKIGFSMTMLAFAVVIFVGLFSVLISRDTVKDRGKDFLVSILRRTSYDINLQINAMEKVTDFVYNEFNLTFNFSKGMTDEDYFERYLDKFKGTVQLAAELSPSKSAFLVLKSEDKSHVLWFKDDNNDGIPEQYEFDETLNRFDFIINNSRETQWIRSESSSVISSIKIIEEAGTTVIVGTDLNYYLLKNNLDTSRYLDSGILFLAENNGDIIYHPKQASGTMSDLTAFGKEGIEAVEAQNDEDVSVVLAKATLNNNWMLVISAETSDIFSGLDRLNYIILIILVVASLISLIYSYVVSSKIAEPYLYLTGKVEEIGKGNYDIEFEQRYLNLEDEVGTFTRALKTTVKRQKDSFDEINDYNQNLETIITKRTEELIKTNEALEESVITTEEKQEKLEVTNKQLEVSIDEIKKTRKQLIKSEKIASSRYMAIGIAHNLNTPIGSAKSIASFIESRTNRILDKFNEDKLTRSSLNEFLIETKSGSGKIIESIDDSIQLIEKMKALSVLNPTENISLVNVEEVIKLQVENSKREFAQMVCGFTILVDARLQFRCDLYNLQKILYELIANSFAHAFHQVESPHITIKAYRNDSAKNGIIIEYYDNGNGVDMKHRSELFTPLYTTKLSSKDGLGLTMVHNLVNDRFDGDISVETVKGRGLYFFIKLYETTNTKGDVYVEK